MVSIVMPYYNAEKYIMETVVSIISQSFQDWELIIVNDCSTESNTENVLESIGKMDTRVSVINAMKNGGAGQARNLGVSIAKGRYISFCDSDDWWYPTKLEEQIRFMQENGYAFTCTFYEDADEELRPYYLMKQPLHQKYSDLLKGCNIGTPGVIYDSSVIGKPLFPELRRAEDWGLWLKILKRVEFIHSLPKPLWKYRHVPGSETSNKIEMIKAVKTMYQSVLNYSSLGAWLMCIFVFLPSNVFKKIKKIHLH